MTRGVATSFFTLLPRGRRAQLWLAGVLVTAIGCYGLGLKVHRVRSQRYAVVTLRAAGYSLEYDTDALRSNSALVRWLAEALGDDYFAQPIAVRMPPDSPGRPTRIPETELRLIAQLSSLESLSHANVLDDRGFAILVGLTNLRRLDLSHTPLTGHALTQLRAFNRLEELRLNGINVTNALRAATLPRSLRVLGLSGTSINDAALAQFPKLEHLEELDLSNTWVGDAGMLVVGRFRHLRKLDLRRTAVDDYGLRHLAGLPDLAELNLDGRPITNDGVAQLANLVGLKSLSLRGSWVTNRSIRHLSQLKSLRTLHLDETRLSDGGFDELERSLPGCVITR